MTAASEHPGLAAYAVRWRRSLHAKPELSFQEKETSARIARELRRLGLEVRTGLGGTGVAGLLRGRGQGRTVALRADMDALPVQEENKCAYRSRVPGAMHACGHDGHCAMLLAAARILADRRREFKGAVKFLFQPGEETPPGGALGMIRDGAMEGPKVDAVFGLHLDSSLATGKVGIRIGPMMAASDNFRITVRGRGGHAARPQDCLDPILTASQIVCGLQAIVSRKVDPVNPAVVTVGKIAAGTKHNIIPETALLEGTARSLDSRTARMMPLWIRQAAVNIARANGLAAEAEYERGYPLLANDPKMIKFARDVVVRTLGQKAAIDIGQPLMGGEDFAYYLNIAPGAFLRLGSRSGPSTGYPWHHPRFDIDEAALPIGARLLAALAAEFLDSK